MIGMQNFQDSLETCKLLFISIFSICMTVPLRIMEKLFVWNECMIIFFSFGCVT